MSSGQKNKFHQSGILQLNTVLVAAFSASKQRTTGGLQSKVCADEVAIGISALEQEITSFGIKSDYFHEVLGCFKRETP